MNSISNNFITYIKGLAIGCADIMPGVSGGTIALILGIYKNLIDSIDSISIRNFKSLNLTDFWAKINGNFLLSLFAGALSSIFTLSFIINYLIENYPIAIWSFFFGILFNSIFIIKRQVSDFNYLNLGLIFFGSIISFFITQIAPKSNDIGLIYLFFCGFFAIIAMILPGISGAYILLILGAYQTVVNLIKTSINSLVNFNFDTLIPTYTKLFVFGLGVLIGLRAFSSVLKWLLDNENNKTMSVLIGLMIGALHKIWPWQEFFELNIGDKVMKFFRPLSPFNYPKDPQILSAIILFIIGSSIVWILDKQKEKK